MRSNHPTRSQWVRTRQRGLALLVVMIVIMLTSLILAGIGNALTTQFAAYRNTADYDKAQYLAAAGVHHGVAMLEDDTTWRGTLSNIELPVGSGDTYSVTAADGTDGQVVLTAEGVAGETTQRIETIVSFGI